MAALKFKQQKDYDALATDEEGRIALAGTPREPAPPYDSDEASASFLDTEIPRARRKRQGCCVCCGMNCSLFWKAFGIVAAGFIIWNAIKLIRWATTDAPTGLENMPVFSSSLGCLTAPHIYNGSKVIMTAPLGNEDDHSFDITGSAVGTFTIAQGLADLKDIKYEMTIRSADPSLLDAVSIRYPNEDTPGRLTVMTPRTGPEAGCMRYDITMYVPPTLKNLKIASHTNTHLQFARDADIELDHLIITLFSMDETNLLLPSQAVRGGQTKLEVFRGWIVGDVAVVDETSLFTQRGDGVLNVRAHPTAPADPESPKTASLRTTSGAGRTDISYIGSKMFKRPISNVHTSSRNADMYLTYREAEFSGRIELASKSYTATGAQPFSAAGEKGTSKWTHWVGNKDGGDEISVKSRGWSGLYF